MKNQSVCIYFIYRFINFELKCIILHNSFGAEQFDLESQILEHFQNLP